jgi:hypothetical protein
MNEEQFDAVSIGSRFGGSVKVYWQAYRASVLPPQIIRCPSHGGFSYPVSQSSVGFACTKCLCGRSQKSTAILIKRAVKKPDAS